MKGSDKMDTRILTLYQQEMYDKILLDIQHLNVSQVIKGTIKLHFNKLIESIIMTLNSNEIELQSLRDTINDLLVNCD